MCYNIIRLVMPNQACGMTKFIIAGRKSNEEIKDRSEESLVCCAFNCGADAVVKDVELTDVLVNVSYSASAYAGGIAAVMDSDADGYKGAVVDGCTVKGAVTLTAENGNSFVGGICSYIYKGAVINCKTDVDVSCTVKSGAAYGEAGGISALVNRALVANCYTLGDICDDAESNNKTTVGGLTGMSGGTNINCYTYGNVGSLVTTVDVGGINGRIAGIAVDHDCFYNSDAAQTIAGREAAEKRSSGTVVGEEINTYPVTAEKMALDKFVKHLNNNKENMTLILKDVSTYLEDMTENNKEGLSHFLFYTGDGSDLNSWTMGTKAPEFKNAAGIRVTYTGGDGCVKLDWSASENAEKYAVCGFVSGKWRILAEGYGTSYVLDDLSSGNYYKVAVIAKTNGVWSKDISNAVYVTPKAVEAHGYPEVSSVVYDENTHQFRLNWSAVDNAEMYGIAVKSAGKWKVQAYTDGDTTEFTSPKLRAGNKYEVVICAKVGGKWDLSDIAGRSFTVTVK